MKHFASILFIFFFFGVQAQNIKVYGLVQNSEGDSLPNAVVKYGEGAQSYVLTKKNGTYEFKVQLSYLKEIEVSYVQNDKIRYLVTQKNLSEIKDNTLEINFTMFDRVLQEVVVGASLPDTFFRSDEYSVADFEIDHQGRVILLTYPRKLQKTSYLKLLDDNQNVIDSYYFSGRAVELITDYRKNVHLVSKEGVHLVAIDNNRIQLLKESKPYFFKYVAPILDTLNDNIYYSNYSEVYPSFDYFQFNRKDSVYTPLLEIINEPLMEQYRAEFKFSDVRTRLWAANKEIESGIDKEIWVGAAIFSNSIYYDPLYAPLFVNKDSIIVFDHYKGLMFKYNEDRSFKDSLPISYHEDERKTGWEQPLIQDKQSGKIYVLFERNGYSYLSLVDLQTGKIKYSRKLHYKYIEKLKIVNNQIFYIYRPFESIQKKYIYQESINL